MEIRIAGFNKSSIVDGVGMRYTIYMQGCKHNCEGCHNPETHDMCGGQIMSTEDIIKEFISYRWIKGITLSGGDPFFQPIQAKELADAAHKYNKDVWAYTGYTIEQIMTNGTNEMKELLSSIDVLVDGRFSVEQKTLNKSFVGSSNQRIIDVQRVLLGETIVDMGEIKNGGL